MHRSPFDPGHSLTNPVKPTTVRDAAHRVTSHPDSKLDRMNRELLSIEVFGVEPSTQLARLARRRELIRAITDRVFELAGRPQLPKSELRTGPLRRECKRCGRSFDQPRRQGRPFSYCELCVDRSEAA